MAKGLSKSNARAYHWRNISEYRPQAKGVERAVGIAKEGIYTNWLAFEQHCQCRIALESPLLGYLVGYVYRTFDVFCDQKRSGTPLERLRDSRGGQKPSSFPFGIIGFSKPGCFSTMEGSEIGVVRLLRDEICHRWWRARFSGEPRSTKRHLAKVGVFCVFTQREVKIFTLSP